MKLQKIKFLGVFIFFSLKLFAQPSLEWAHSIPFDPKSNYKYENLIDKDGNQIIAGTFDGHNIDFDYGVGAQYLSATGLCVRTTFIQKVTPSGVVLWSKAFNASRNEFKAMVLDSLGNIYLTGKFYLSVDVNPSTTITTLTTTGASDIYLVKLNTNGSLLWAKSFGGTSSEEPSCLKIDANNNLIVGGTYQSSDIDFDPGVGIHNAPMIGASPDAFVLKLDNNGNFIWVYTFGAPNWNDIFSDMVVDANNNIIIAAYFAGSLDVDPSLNTFILTNPPSCTSSGLIIKLDPNKNFLWAQKFGSSGLNYTTAIDVGSNGDIVLGGRIEGATDMDNGIGTHMLNGNSPFLLKLGSNGNFIWTQELSGTGFTSITELEMDSYNNIYTLGTYSGVLDFDNSSTVYADTAVGIYDIFITKIDLNGNFIWETSLPSVNGQLGYELVVTDQQDFYVIGRFLQQFNFNTHSPLISSNGTTNFFALKLTENLFSSNSNPNSLVQVEEIKIYPNPASDLIFVKTKSHLLNSIVLTDGLGKIVCKKDRIRSLQITVNLEDYPAGIYYIHIESDREQTVEKIIKY